MKKRFLMILLAAVTAFSLAFPGRVYADCHRVVTLGADLKEGSWRELTADELRLLRNAAEMGQET